jgi:hypothetical protein
MTPHEFVLWFKGFTQAVDDYSITPARWDTIKEQLDKVYSEDKTKETRYTLDNSNWNTTNTTAGRRSDVTYKQDVLTTNTVF